MWLQGRLGGHRLVKDGAMKMGVPLLLLKFSPLVSDTFLHSMKILNLTITQDLPFLFHFNAVIFSFEYFAFRYLITHNMNQLHHFKVIFNR